MKWDSGGDLFVLSWPFGVCFIKLRKENCFYKAHKSKLLLSFFIIIFVAVANLKRLKKKKKKKKKRGLLLCHRTKQLATREGQGMRKKYWYQKLSNQAWAAHWLKKRMCRWVAHEDANCMLTRLQFIFIVSLLNCSHKTIYLFLSSFSSDWWHLTLIM